MATGSRKRIAFLDDVSKEQIGLPNVDNTSDMDKPVSTAQQAELDKKTNNTDFTKHSTSTENPHGVTKTQVGLGNVDNKSSETIRSELTKENVTNALGYTPPTTNTTYGLVTDTDNGLMYATDKVKLDGVAENANNYVHPDAHAATMITQDETHRFVSDTEKSTWNDKASTATATTTANGLMSSDDKTKLEGIDTGANNYTHPANHPASIITQDENNRFVTDTEKNTWNGKASTAVASTSADGLMSKDDKSKLDNVAENANNYTHPDTHAATMITEDENHRFVTDTEKSTWNDKASTAVATTSANGLMSSTQVTDLNTLVTKATKKYTTTIGDGSTTEFTVTHGLGQSYVQVTAVNNNGYNLWLNYQIINTTQVKITFDTAPATNSITVIVVG